MDKLKWKTEVWPISKLKPAQYNPRKLSKKQKADLATSLERFSLAEPIIINQNGTIIGGHQRYYILKAQGVKEIACSVPSRLLSETEERELNLRLNKNLGEWDLDLLRDFEKDLLEDVGFEEKEINKLTQVEDPIEYEIDENIETKNECPSCGYKW